MTKPHPKCKCDLCPLKGRPYVPSETYPNAQTMVIGDFPSKKEAKEGRPFLGWVGNHVTAALRNEGIGRESVHWTNTVACVPKRSMVEVLKAVQDANSQIAKQNLIRKKNGEPLMDLVLTPYQACKGRLDDEIESVSNIIALGKKPMESLLYFAMDHSNMRGTPIESNGKKIIVTLDPTVSTFSKNSEVIFNSDIEKAARWFLTGLDWCDPKITYDPSYEELEQFIRELRYDRFFYDIEVNGIDPLKAKIRCIAIGDQDHVMVVGLKKIGGEVQLEADSAMVALLRNAFEDECILKVGHNVAGFDNIVMEKQLGISVKNYLDTITLHRIVEPDMPHDLGFLGSYYTDAPSWKADRIKNKRLYGETDRELHQYCARDVAVTAALYDKIHKKANAIDTYDHLIKTDHAIQQLAGDMQMSGFPFGKGVLVDMEGSYSVKMDLIINQICNMLEVDHFNPNSPKQISDLIAEWEIEPPTWYRGKTIGGTDLIRALLTLPHLDYLQRSVLSMIYRYRYYQGYSEEMQRWIVKMNGRMPIQYTSHSSNVGGLNVDARTASLVKMLIDHRRYFGIHIEFEYFEDVFAAIMYGSQLYVDALKNDYDFHATTAYVLFDKGFEQAAIECGAGAYPWIAGTKFLGKAASLMALSKAFFRAAMYKADISEIYERLVKVMNLSHGQDNNPIDMPYIYLTLKEVRVLYNRWLAASRFQDGWDRVTQEYFKKEGELKCIVSGRTCRFTDNPSNSEIIAWPIRAAKTALADLIVSQINDRFPHKIHYYDGVNLCMDSSIDFDAVWEIITSNTSLWTGEMSWVSQTPKS